MFIEAIKNGGETDMSDKKDFSPERQETENAAKSKYIALYEQIRRDIVAGVYAAGCKLPSKRNMAEEMNVSVITVEHAYGLLVDEGYVSAEEKRGYFVIYDAESVFPVGEHVPHSLKNEGLPAENEGLRIPFPLLSPPLYMRLSRKVMSAHSGEIFEKSPRFGVERLRKSIAAYLRRSRGIRAEASQIVIGAGAEYLYGMIVKALGRRIVYGIENPSYQNIRKVYEAEGADLKMLPLGKNGIESAELWRADVKVLHITPYRSFPTGVTASASKKHEYIRWCNEKKTIIIEDDFESEFSPSRKPEETLFAMNNGQNVIYVNTFTRTIGPFIRAAYMVIPEDMTGLFNERIGFYSCPVPTPEQYILAELIENGDFERHLNRVRRSRR